MVSYTLKEMVSYTLKAGGDGRLHPEAEETSLHTEAGGDGGYTLKAGGDGRLHTEGWRRRSATH